MNKSLTRWWLAVGLVALAGCAYQGSDNPLARKFTWFSYLNGDDIRAACGPGAPEKIRAVYNAVYTEQVRAYDITAERGGYRLTARVTEPAELGRLFAGPPGDILAPWRATIAKTDLGQRQFAGLKRALGRGGALGPAPAGLELPSHGFYWTLAACTGGRFQFSAFLWPSPEFGAQRFAELLFSWDRTGVAVNKPRKVTLFDIYGTMDEDEYLNVFTLLVAKNGLSLGFGDP